jgi:flagellar hook-associated protein FlgK
MNNLSAIATSGMNAAMQGMDAAAHNIANEQTPDFHRQTVLRTAQPEGGVTVTLSQEAQAGTTLSSDVVQQMVELYTFKATPFKVFLASHIDG